MAEILESFHASSLTVNRRENMSNECPSCNQIGYGRENMSLGETVRKPLIIAFVADQQDDRRAWRFRTGVPGEYELLV